MWLSTSSSPSFIFFLFVAWTFHANRFCFFLVNANSGNNNMRYQGHCYLKYKKTVKLQYDPMTESYSRIEGNGDDNNQQHRHRFLSSDLFRPLHPQEAIRVQNQDPFDDLPHRRQLSTTTTTFEETSSKNNQSSSSSLAQFSDTTYNNQTVVYVRECSCLTDTQYPKYSYYCPLELGICFVPRCGSKECLWPPSCFNKVDMAQVFVRSIWPVVIVMFALLFTFLLCTQPGKLAILYWFTFCIPSLNNVIVRCMLRNRPEHARAMIRDWVLRHRPHILRHLDDPVEQHQDEEQQQQQFQRSGRPLSHDEEELLRELQEQHQHGRPSLVLKTRIYKTTSIQTEDEISSDKKEEEEDDAEDSAGEQSPKMMMMNSDLSTSHNFNDTEEDHLVDESCTICFGPLQTGDRVGNLPCQHTFHVDCLKVWLKKRAVCPLCLRTDVVVRRHEEGNIRSRHNAQE